MHHKNKRTVQKEVKRLDHKSARAKARTALDGGPALVARSNSWSNTVPQPPVIDEVGRHKSKTKKPAPKKDKCPCNNKHEWYKEWVLVERWFLNYSYRVNEYQWTCIHCWKTKVVQHHSLRDYGYARKAKPRTAYRRPRD